jgi:biopolymer transport protein ExbD
MAAVKPKRHGPAMDMTAMCDVAFLLLTFFIMTTQFKSQETVKVVTPSSVSKLIVEEKNIATISIDPQGRYYFGITEPMERASFINQLNTDLSLNLTQGEMNAFAKLAEVGVGKDQLKSYLNLQPEQRERVNLTGIPLDSAKTELVDWVKAYAKTNPSGNLAVKGDVTTQYPAVKTIFDEFGKADINKFRLITKGE